MQIKKLMSCRGTVTQDNISLFYFIIGFLRGLTGQLVKREMRKSEHKGNIQPALTAAESNTLDALMTTSAIMSVFIVSH